MGDGDIGNRKVSNRNRTVKWCHSNLWSRYDLHLVGHYIVPEKLTGEDLSHYLKETKSVGLRKAYVFSEEITSLSTYVYNFHCIYVANYEIWYVQ